MGKKTALLFGAPYGTLRAVPASLERLAGALTAYGFECETHPQAPREPLLRALDGWTARVDREDAAVLVYVGHGGRRDGVGYLAPCRSGAPLREVLALELGGRLVALARRTSNVTLVLDCCHAAAMVEDPTHLEAWELQQVLAAQAEALERGQETVMRSGSPLGGVVQLAAAAAPQTAMEDHERGIGLFSAELAAVLERCRGREVAWFEVMEAVRDRVRAVYEAQFPVLLGPRRFAPFTGRDSARRGESFAVRREGEALATDAGKLRGVANGDSFVIHALGEAPAADAAIVRVTAVGLMDARLQRVDGGALPAGDVPLRMTKLASGRQAGQTSSRELVLPAEVYDIRWGRVDGEGRPASPLADEGASLGGADEVWLTLGVRANRRVSELYFAVFHVDPPGRWRSLCPRHAHGIVLRTDERRLLATRLVHGLGAADELMLPRGASLLAGAHCLQILMSADPIDVAAISEDMKAMRGDRPPSLYAMHRVGFTVPPSVVYRGAAGRP